MTHHPYGPDELDRLDPELDDVAERIERYAAQRADAPPIGLAARIRASVDEVPAPVPPWWKSISAWSAPARALVTAAGLVAAVVGVLALGEIADIVRNGNVGASPSAPAIVSPSASPSATPSPTPSAVPSPSESPSPSVDPSPSPSASDDDASGSPEPSDSDNSGPGGGGGDDSGDNSGPGGGDDGGSSGSGSGD